MPQGEAARSLGWATPRQKANNNGLSSGMPPEQNRT